MTIFGYLFHSQKQTIAEAFDLPFFECSCKQNINIQEAFLALARLIRDQRERRATRQDDFDRIQWDRGDVNHNQGGGPGPSRCSSC
ncbi:hypothetical protein LAZ67_6002030 [Cordylochernes scorpioides]|uniref:Uncharacterized protein n=1 Tax=Cordylochernes scorpioides TaxID=51811 RepID=A0ABY6KLE6_9ARAC|nr:hypothetical protein LAZ67_6002030 [Cordylochernes scorpioides]